MIDTTKNNIEIKREESLTNHDAAKLAAVSIELEILHARYNLPKGLLYAIMKDDQIEILTIDKERTAREIIDDCFKNDKEEMPNLNRKERRKLKLV